MIRTTLLLGALTGMIIGQWLGGSHGCGRWLDSGPRAKDLLSCGSLYRCGHC